MRALRSQRRLRPLQHLGDAVILALLVTDARRQFEFDLLLTPRLIDAGLHPMDLGEIDAGGLGEKAARIDARGLRPFRNADALAFQVLRLRNLRSLRT